MNKSSSCMFMNMLLSFKDNVWSSLYIVLLCSRCLLIPLLSPFLFQTWDCLGVCHPRTWSFSFHCSLQTVVSSSLFIMSNLISLYTHCNSQKCFKFQECYKISEEDFCKHLSLFCAPEVRYDITCGWKLVILDKLKL